MAAEQPTAGGAVAPVWCAVANIVRERHCGPGGPELRHGTAHLSPGAKVHVRNAYWGTGGEQVEVVGRQRCSHRLVTMVLRANWLESPRVKLVYRPAVIARLVAPPVSLGTSAHGDGFIPWDGSAGARARAERIVPGWRRASSVDAEATMLREPQARTAPDPR